MAARRSEHPTMFELLSKAHVGKARGKHARYVTTGKNPKPFPKREGLIVLEPDQALTVRVAHQRVVDGSIRGYQRRLDIGRVNQIAKWILDNPDDYLRELPAVEVSLDDGVPFASDGQHRLAGAVVANKPIMVAVVKRTQRQAKALFAGQSKARRVNRNVLIFDGESVFEEYIQDAVTNKSHPWNGLISTSGTLGGGTNRISATSALIVLQTYVAGITGSTARLSETAIARFDKAAADELVELINAFGNRSANPFAFSGGGLRATAIAAHKILRHENAQPQDKERWMKHMPKFPFAQYQYLRSNVELADQMVRWWNRHLPSDRKIS